jgi:hypothetical protein
MIYVIKTKDGNRITMEVKNGRVNVLSENHPEGIPGDHFAFCRANPPGENFLDLIGGKPKVGLSLIAYKYINGKSETIYISDEITEVY